MTELRTPLKHALRKTTNEASVARMWARIEARERTATRAPALPRAWALAAAAILVLGIAFFGVRRVRHGEATAHAPLPPAAPTAPSSLVRADGAPFVAVHAAGEPASVTFTDGSRIALSPGASIEPRTNDDHLFALQQLHGRVHYDVTPGGPRRWTIACGKGGGATTVEVVGTSFDIDTTDAHVRVDVSHGVVLVRGEGVPDGQARLVAGGSIDVATGVHDVRDLHDSTEPPPPSTPVTPAPPAAWKQLAANGDHGAAYAALGPEGLAKATKAAANVDELLALADVARLSGHPGDAVPPLARIVAAHPGDPRASLAALTLGRIELTSLGDPHAATAALRSALALGIPRDLEGDTHALLVEALGRDGDAAGARATYDVYVARHPAHPKRESVARWIREP